MSIPTEVIVKVYADPDYHYEVSAGEQFSVTYIDKSNKIYVSFGSVEEMKVVANAMLKVADTYKHF